MLRRLAEDYDPTLHVAHLNHQIRGTEAEADAASVAGLAAEWSLPKTPLSHYRLFGWFDFPLDL